MYFFFRNPNEHHKQDAVLAASRERNRFRSIVWDEYDSVHQKYLEIGKWLMTCFELRIFSQNSEEEKSKTYK